MPSERVEVFRAKELETHPGDEIIAWGRGQLEISRSILDNPGGGLLFAAQTIGQVRSGLHERDALRWEAVTDKLATAELAAVHREFEKARGLLDEVISALKG